MAEPSGESLTDAMKFIFDEDNDATEIFLPGKNEPRLNLKSAGKSKDGKSRKGKTKSCQQERYPTVLDDCLQDQDDDIFGHAFLKKDSVPPSVEENTQNHKSDAAELQISCASSSAVDSSSSLLVHSNIGTEVNSCENENLDMPSKAKAMDVFGNENSQFNFSLNLPEHILSEKGKKYENISKTCTSSTIPPDEVVIEAMKLIFDDNIDATRIFALEKKEPVKLNPCSYDKGRESGSVKIKTKQKRYWSVLDDLLDDDSDDIFGTAVSKQNKSSVPEETKVAEGEFEQPHLAVEESLRNSHDLVPEDAASSREENRKDVLDVSRDPSETEVATKHESDSASDSFTIVPQGLNFCTEVEVNDSCQGSKGQEIDLDIKQKLCSLEPVTKNESDLALENLKVPFADSPFDSCDNEIKGKETSFLKHEKLKSNLSTSSPNKRKKSDDITSDHEMLDVISNSSGSEEEEYEYPSKKRKQTGSALESELTQNYLTEAESMLTKTPNFDFLDHPGLEKTFTGHLRNAEEAAEHQDRKEKLMHRSRARPSMSKPCQPIFREVDDKEIEALFVSGKHKNIPTTEINSEMDVVRQAKESLNSVRDVDSLKISDPLLNTESSDDAESFPNADYINLLRNRKSESNKNLQEDLHLAKSGVSLAGSLESSSDSEHVAKSGVDKLPQECTSSFIFRLPPAFLCNAFLLCVSGILLVTMPLLLLFLPIYILAVFNAVFLTGILIVGAVVFTRCCGKAKAQARSQYVHGTDVKHLQLPEIKKLQATDDVFQGWMNELHESYDVSSYHISHLRSVYVSLDRSTLRLRTPKKRIPKRAVCSESLPIPGSFIKQRFYNLCGSKVTTLPEGLVSRRLWSKKYPILIEIPAERKYKKNPSIGQTEGRREVQEVERWNENNCTRLFLFARTCREKEEWFRRFLAATLSSPLSPCVDGLVQNTPVGTSVLPSSSETKKDIPSGSEGQTLHSVSDDQIWSDYLSSMAKVLSVSNDSTCDLQLLWVNAFIFRCTMDVFREDHRIEVIKRKMEKKLLTAKIPYFMDDVRLVEFDLGKELPLICKATPPSLDGRGLWVDLEISYRGRIRFTVETKCNLFKLKGMSPTEMPKVHKSSAATNPDEEDSGESSTDDSSDGEDVNDFESREKPKVNWLLKLADRITSSRYFQRATKVERIKKVMESVSSKSLMLSVEICSVKGTLAVNIPPPPTDRLWYGFRTMPELEMSVAVQVGQRQIALTALTSWIEKKLIVELERALVMPNMDDILVPLMCDHVTNRHIPPTGNQT